MKRIIIGLMMAMLLCAWVQGANRTVTENDSLGNKKKVIELRDTVVGGKTVTDTLSVMTYDNSTDEASNDEDYKHHYNSDFNWGDWDMGKNAVGAIVAVTAIVFVFGFPLIVIFIIFFFRYKNRKAKYRLVEQALASGQPLPEDFLKKADIEDTRTKGIKNAFTGIGLFIFLWALTGEFGLGCIGLLIMFTGLGQLVIHYTQQKKDGEPFIDINNDENTGKSNIKVGGINICNQEKSEKKDEEK